MQIFLAHAEVDKPAVRVLYQRLREAGFQPWIDDEDIIPGQNKREAIPKAIKESDLFIACLSSRSVNQAGDLMRQLRQSLDRMAEMPPDEIYLVPLKLDRCEIPDLQRDEEGIKLQDYQSLDYFAEDGWERLLKTIRTKSETTQQPGSKADFPGNSVLIRFDIPFKRNQYFTGRQRVIDQLHATLSQTGTTAINQVQAVYGLGGIGKTQTAVEYAYRYFYEKKEYEWVFWVNGETEINLRDDYGKIAGQLQLGVGIELEEKIEAVKQWLQSHENWLLIFDNADHPEWVENFIPPRAQGKVLITSRASVFDMLGVTEPVALASFEVEEAVRFLYQRLGKEVELAIETDINDAAALAEELGYLPLALEQAAAFILRRKVSFGIYLKKYRKQKISLLEKVKPQQKNYPKSVLTTWSINFEQVQESSETAAELLKFSAFLSPDAIPYELLFRGSTKLDEPLASALAAEDIEDFLFELSELLEPLAQYSLIQTQPENYSYSIHRMVQEVLREGMNVEIKSLWVNQIVSAIAQAALELETFENWSFMARLLPHAIQTVKQARTYDFESEALGYLLHQIGFYLDVQGRYREAEAYYQQSLAMFKKLFGSEHLHVATSLNNLAASYRSQGRYEEAEPCYQQSLAMMRKLFGSEHSNVATSLNNLAELYRSMGRVEEAESYFQQSLAMRRKLFGSEHSHIASSLNNLAEIYHEVGRYEEAESYYQQSLAMRRKLLGSEHPDIAQSLNNLAAYYESIGRVEEAELYYQQSLAMMRKLLGSEHPDVATSLNNLAGLYKSMGRVGEAELYYQQSLAMIKKLLGIEHPSFAISLNNLAVFYQSQGRYEEAESYLQQSLAIRRKLLRNDHPSVVTSLNNLAELYLSIGRYEEAESYYQQTLAMIRKLFGKEHLRIATTLNNLAGLYRSICRYKEAESYCQQALAMYQKLFGNDNLHVATTFNNLALLYNSMGRYEEAEPYYQQSLVMSKQLLGNEHPDIAISLNNLAGLYCSIGRYEDAEPYYQQSLAMSRKLLGNDHLSVAISLNNLAELYRLQGKYEEAEPYYQQSLAMSRKLLGRVHPYVASSLNNLAVLYDSMDRVDEAIEYYQAAIAIAKKCLGENHPNTQTFMTNFSQMLRDVSKDKFFRKSNVKKLVESRQGFGSWMLQKIRRGWCNKIIKMISLLKRQN